MELDLNEYPYDYSNGYPNEYLIDNGNFDEPELHFTYDLNEMPNNDFVDIPNKFVAIETPTTEVKTSFSQPISRNSLSLIELNYSSDDDEEEINEAFVEFPDNPPRNYADAVEIFSDLTEELCEDVTENFTTDLMFTDQNALIEWCREVGISCRFVVVTTNSDSTKNGRKPRVVLACERSGEYRERTKKANSGKASRKTGTKKCNCPFKLRGILDGQNQWKIIVDCGLHNHYFGANLIGHSYVSKLTVEEQKLVTDLTLGGVKPREIQIILKERFPKNLSTRKTIYNFRARHKLKTFEGRSQMQQLFKDLNDHGYMEFHRENTSSGECLDIFLAHPESILLAKCFPEVIILDCTYKTNLHKLPLLEIVGFTSTMKTFSIAYVYLESEKQDNYLWALQKLHQVLENKANDVEVIVTDCEIALMNVIPKVFPHAKHLLCRWHITTNIKAKYKKTFKTIEEWDEFEEKVKDLMDSSKLVDYNNNLQKLKR